VYAHLPQFASWIADGLPARIKYGNTHGVCEDSQGRIYVHHTVPRETLSSGRFVCPHGACFDHEGNIFVVEWVEVGRVTKLRRLA
jgi:hypothetical protein